MANIQDTLGMSAADASAANNPILLAITDAMVKAHPDLAQVRELYRQKRYAEALTLLYSTQYYQDVSGVRFNNEDVKLNRPGVYEDIIKNQWIPVLRAYALQQGLKVSNAVLDTIARKAYDMGWGVTSPATMELFAGKDDQGIPYVESIAGGVASSTRDFLNSAIMNYGVKYGQDWVDNAAKSVAEGLTTQQQWMDEIKNQAKSAFPAWSKQIDGGMTMRQIASPYISSYATILGIDPASITLDDQLLMRGLQGTNPTDPTMSSMPLWEFEKTVRKDPRWAFSKDAMDGLTSVGYGLLRQWGVMG